MNASFTSHAGVAPDNLLAGELYRVTRKVTIAAGADLTRGAALGKVTANGKYKLSASADSDGSQTVTAVLAEDAAASAADVEAVIYLSGEFNATAMSFGTGHTSATAEGGLIFIHTNVAA